MDFCIDLQKLTEKLKLKYKLCADYDIICKMHYWVSGDNYDRFPEHTTADASYRELQKILEVSPYLQCIGAKHYIREGKKYEHRKYEYKEYEYRKHDRREYK